MIEALCMGLMKGRRMENQIDYATFSIGGKKKREREKERGKSWEKGRKEEKKEGGEKGREGLGQ